MIVSIIIPVFNTKYEDLLKCLDSILAQTFPNFEVVIIDDGSEDYYGNRLDELVQLDSRISVFHKKNEGVSVARNFGVNKATGQYILFVDGDDILTPWLLESAVQAVEDYDCDVIVGMINTTDKRPSIFPSREKNVKFELLDDHKKKELECHIFSKSCERWRPDQDGWEFNGEGCWAHFLKKEIALENQFIPGVAVGEDTIWALTMLNSSKDYRIGMLYEKWYYYIQNDYRVVNKYNPKIVGQLTLGIVACSRDGRNQMRGSKYIQSKMGDTYKKVQEDLNAKREVLFSGTSCQVAGLKHFLGKDYDNLICIDIVCHGVPSPVVWDKYLRWQEHKNHGKVVKVDFRNKKDFGWKDHVETIWFDNGKNVSSPIFKNLFYGHMVLRPSCYECPYKSIMHPGDITIADYWGIEKAAPEFDDNKGVSLVLVNNEKADSIFENVKIELKWKSTRIEDSMQPPLKAPFPKPEGREQFWNDVNDKSFSYIARAYGDNGTANYIKKVLRRAKRKIQHLISKT